MRLPRHSSIHQRRAATCREAAQRFPNSLDDLDRQYPGIRFRMIGEQGQIRSTAHALLRQP